MIQLHDLLPRAAGDDVPVSFDHTDVGRRVQRRARQRRVVALASIVAVILLGAGAVALASRSGEGDREGVYAHDDTAPVTGEELTAGPWVAVASGQVTTGGNPPLAVSVAFDADGTLVVVDECEPSRAEWTLDGRRLLVEDLVYRLDEIAADVDRPACTTRRDTALGAILADGPTVSRPTELPGTLELRSPRGFVTFERFDRLGAVPTADDLAGTSSEGRAWAWSSDPSSTTLTFAADGTLRIAPDPCRDDLSWAMDGDLLAIETEAEGNEAGATCFFTSFTSHDPFDGASRVRIGDDRLWIDLEGAVMLWHLVDPDAEAGPHLGTPGESAKDVAERVTDVVLGDPAIATDVQDDGGGLSVVTLETGSGVTLRAEVAYVAASDTYRLERLDTPGLTVTEAGGFQATIPEPGRILVTGYDDGLTPPGEVMVDGREGVAGTTDPLDLPESAWLHVQVTTDGGRALHHLAPRT